MTTPEEILRTTFGFSSFRPYQKDIIMSALQNKDTFVLMPTGGGKSLCYQIPALVKKGVTIVVSPLIALMKDQVDALRLSGVNAAFLNSTLLRAEENNVRNDLRNGKLSILYVAPERIFSRDNELMAFLKHIPVSLIAIDGAHCISSWGHEFRPDYLKLRMLRVKFPDIPVMALTATADRLTRADIIEKLDLIRPDTFIASFNRPNIQYMVQPKNDSYDQLVTYLQKHRDESGIVYTLSRKSAERIAGELSEDGFSALPYHAGLDTTVRNKHQDMFIKDQVNIIVATIAFGMGIDKSNVRYVVHMDMPKNIEGYYQETGRAGRDGLPGDALLFYSRADVIKLRDFVTVDGNPQRTRIMTQKLEKMAAFAESFVCRRKFLLNYFDEEHPDSCSNCDRCTGVHTTFDGTVIAQKALSAVYRLEGRFGIRYVIDILRGSRTKRVRPYHQTLPTFGVGKDVSVRAWRQHINELIHHGYLNRTADEYPVLTLTGKSRAVLKGEKTVRLTVVEEKETFMGTVKTKEHDIELFNKLRQLRSQIAQEERVPAYLIFSDATLVELATYFPQSPEDLHNITGFGTIKMEKYGRAFLNVVTAYCRKNAISSRMGHKVRTSRRQRIKRTLSGTTDTKLISLNMFEQGKTIGEIARARQFALSTIEGHLASFIPSGHIRIEQLVSKEHTALIQKAISQHGTTALKPIKESLPEEISYGEIRAVIVYEETH